MIDNGSSASIHELRIRSAFAVALISYRLGAYMSQQELADHANMERSFVSRLERGLATPSIYTVVRLAVVLNVHPKDLLFNQQTNKL